MRGKKGIAEEQLHWVFILIAGTVILAFFANIVIKQKGISESKVAITVVRDLETVTTGASISKGTAQILDKPDFDLEFDCEFCNCKYTMKGNSKQLGDNIIFAPTRLTGRNIIAWTKDWNAPFRITNFLFLTTPLTRYYLVYESGDDVFDFINTTLPSTINKVDILNSEFTTKIQDHNYPQIKIVYININPLANPDHADHFSSFRIKKNDVSIVHIQTTAGGSSYDYDEGYITFYKLKDSSGTYIYEMDKGLEDDGGTLSFIGVESIFAAIFSHNYEIYSCNMAKAFEKMSFILGIYKDRIGMISSYGHGCSGEYDNCNDKLNDLIDISDAMSSNILTNISSSFGSYQSIYSELDISNRQLQIRSCPSVY
jgi:hypothetical protein